MHFAFKVRYTGHISKYIEDALVTHRRAIAPANYMTWFSLTLIKTRYLALNLGSSM